METLAVRTAAQAAGMAVLEVRREWVGEAVALAREAGKVEVALMVVVAAAATEAASKSQVVRCRRWAARGVLRVCTAPTCDLY